MEFSGIYVDENELDQNFIDEYEEVHRQINSAYKSKFLTQEQFRSLQQEITETYYSEFFIREIDCGTDLIEILKDEDGL
jgi:hypothetical protein